MENTLYYGDNLGILREFIPDESVDLIYLDPPFFSNKHYEVIWNDGAEIRAFEDRWKGGVYHYVEWMTERLEQCYRILKETGTIYLHCDWHASHYLKVAMDKIFGENNFQNEIVWHYRTGNIAEKIFARRHDTIFRYSKTNKWTFNPIEVKESTLTNYSSIIGMLITWLRKNGNKHIFELNERLFIKYKKSITNDSTISYETKKNRITLTKSFLLNLDFKFKVSD